jgi:hypothetical protein
MNFLTPLGRIIPEKLTVDKLVKKFAAFYWNRGLHKSLSLDHIMNHTNPVRTIKLYCFRIHVNHFLTSTPVSLNLSPLYVFCLKFSMHFSSLPSHPYLFHLSCAMVLILLLLLLLWSGPDLRVSRHRCCHPQILLKYLLL